MSRFAPFVKGFVQGMGIAQERELYNRKIEELDRQRNMRNELSDIYSNPQRYQRPAIDMTGYQEGTQTTEAYKPAPEMQMQPGGALGTAAMPGQDLRTTTTEKTLTPVQIQRPARMDNAARMRDVSNVAGKYGDPATAMQWQVAAEDEPARELSRQAREAYGTLLSGDYEGAAKRMSMLYDSIPDGRVANVRFEGNSFIADIYDQNSGKLLRSDTIAPDKAAQRLLAMHDPKLAHQWAQDTIKNSQEEAKLQLQRDEIAKKYGPKWDIKTYGENNEKAYIFNESTGQFVSIDSASAGKLSKQDLERMGNIPQLQYGALGATSLSGLTEDKQALALGGAEVGQRLYMLNRHLAGTSQDVDGAYAKMGIALTRMRMASEAERLNIAAQEGFTVHTVNGQQTIMYGKEGSPYDFVTYGGHEYVVNDTGKARTATGPVVQGATAQPKSTGPMDPKKPAQPAVGLQPKSETKYWSRGPNGNLVPDNENGIYVQKGTGQQVDPDRAIQLDATVKAFDAAIADAARRGLNDQVQQLMKAREAAAKAVRKKHGFADGGLIRDGGRSSTYVRQGQKKGANPVEVFRKRPMANAPVGQVPVAAGGGNAKDRFGRPVTALGRVGGMPAIPDAGVPIPGGPAGRKAEAQPAITMPYNPAPLPAGTPLGGDVDVRPFVPAPLDTGTPLPETPGIYTPDPYGEQDAMNRSYANQDMLWDSMSRQRNAHVFGWTALSPEEARGFSEQDFPDRAKAWR